jgi:hypothetical protein
MPVISKEELKGNPPAKARKAPAAEAPAKTTAVSTTPARAQIISAADARELGESAITTGALDRAEQHVAGGRGVYPPSIEQPKRITVDREGKVIPPEQATEGATVLVGAEAEAYVAKHGGKLEGGKEADKTADKSRKARPATKAKAARRR